MIKRPLDRRFAEAVKEGRKITTIRKTSWPLHTPIMLFHWEYKPYRSKHMNVCAVQAILAKQCKITHYHGGEMEYIVDPFLLGMFNATDFHLWEAEGFNSKQAMDEWFREAVPAGSSEFFYIMMIQLLDPQP